jgi:phospholipid/cholesterol/gamma-HCH transport system substrate-binding protein
MLVGAVTVLIAVVAVFLAYNANNGLPFVSAYRISVEVPNASTLIKGNEVRIGGVRVGQVVGIAPEAGDDGSVSAKVDLELDQDQKPLPDDSTVIVRSRSALGLKYLEITRGTGSQGLQDGGSLPLSAAQPEPVEIDQLFNTFDQPTRDAIQVNLTEFGNALAGRGAQLNGAIQEIRPLLEVLEPVTRNLASPQTDLRGFITGLSRAAAEVAPVAEQQADLFVSLDATFGALATVARPYIQQAIERTPETFDTLARTSPRINRFVDDTAGLFGDLRPGFAALAPTAPVLLKAVKAGIPALKASPKLNAELDPTAQSLLTFSQNASARTGIDQLTQAMQTLDPTVSFITPAQSVCNYGSLLFRNVSSLLSLGDGIGTWQRFIAFAPPDGPNNEGSPSSAPANGGGNLPGNYLHYNPYPNTAAPGQVHECEAGNETYINGQTVIGNVPGDQGTNTAEQLSATSAKCKKGLKKNKKGKCVKRKPKKRGES